MKRLLTAFIIAAIPLLTVLTGMTVYRILVGILPEDAVMAVAFFTPLSVLCAIVHDITKQVPPLHMK
jgi:hypothetical protein